MTISPQEAAEALSEIERATGQSQTLRGYRFSAPFLWIWGVIWILGYGAMGVLPPRDWDLVWGPLDMMGVVLSFLWARTGRKSGVGTVGPSFLAAFGMVALFCGAVLFLFYPAPINAYLAFPGLVTGLVYSLFGVFRLMRFIVIGAAIMAASMAGYVFLPHYLAFWMAAMGGGGLILGGLWLRRA